MPMKTSGAGLALNANRVLHVSEAPKGRHKWRVRCINRSLMSGGIEHD